MTAALRPMPRIGRLAAALVVSVVLCAAGEPPASDPAVQLVETLAYDDYYDTVSRIAVESALAQLKSKGMSDEDLAAARANLDDTARGNKAAFLEKVAAAYRSRFSAAELQQLSAFYQSPLGRKVNEAQKPIQDEAASATRDTGVLIGVSAAQLLK